MDPVTALGAAGSVIGIAGFGFQLSAAIYQFYSQIGDARESVQAAVDGIDSTAVALNRIHDFLRVEEDNLRSGKGLLLFSSAAILGVKDTAHKCMAIFWRIEATITNKNGPKFEEELLHRLLRLKRNTGSKQTQPLFELDGSLTETATSLRSRFRWTFKGDFTRLEGYIRRLQQFQMSLTLMFSVVTLGFQRSYQQEDWKQTAAYNYIRGIAGQGNIHIIAAQFSHNTEPVQTQMNTAESTAKDSKVQQPPKTVSSEPSLPIGSSMARSQRTSTLAPAFVSYLSPVRNNSTPRSEEEEVTGRDPVYIRSRRSISSTASMGDPNLPDMSPNISGVPGETIDASTVGPRTAWHRRQSQVLEPGTEPAHAIDPHLNKSAITAPTAELLGQTQERTGAECTEGKPATASRIASQNSGSNSVTTDLYWEGTSISLPEAQKCVYIIKHGRSHAIPHRLAPGLRDLICNTLGLHHTQKSVYKKLASLTPENMAALEAVLNDGGYGSQTRKLVQLSTLQKSPFHIGANQESAVMAIVEDPNPQRPWREDEKNFHESGNDAVGPSSTYPRSAFHGGPHHSEHKEIHSDTLYSGHIFLTAQHPHRGIQNVSRDMMNNEDYQEALTKYRVWVIQKHSSLKRPEIETQSWIECTVVEDVCSHEDVTQRLRVLDSKYPSAHVKKLSLRPDQQTQIDRLHESVTNSERHAEYQWSLRQLEVIRSRSTFFQLVPTVTAIFVYLARTPRAQVDLRRLFEMKHVAENENSQKYTSQGAQPYPSHQSAPNFGNYGPGNALPNHQPDIPDYNYGFPQSQWPITAAQTPLPLAPGAPYNPHGPPGGIQQPQLGPTGGAQQPPNPYIAPCPKPHGLAHERSDESSDWSKSSSYVTRGDATKNYPERGRTRMPAHLVSKRALVDLGYPFVEEGDEIVVLKDLGRDKVDDMLKLSRNYEKPDGEYGDNSANQQETHHSSTADPRPPLITRTGTMQGRSPDHSFIRTKAQKHAGNSLAVTTYEVAKGITPENQLSSQQRSLTRRPTLRRNPSELHPGSSATARLGIPQAEIRLALEASRVCEGLHRSVPDPNLAERRPIYPSQFDGTPYDPQPNADDQIINQLLLDWTPHGADIPRGDEGGCMETQHGIICDYQPIDGEGGEKCRGISSAIVDKDHASSEHSEPTRREAILQSHQDVDIPNGEIQILASAETGSRTDSKRQERAEDGERLLWDIESIAEIKRLENQLATLKSARDAKEIDRALLPELLVESSDYKDGEMPASATLQATKEGGIITTQQEEHRSCPQKPRQAAVQRRVTIDEVEDEGDGREPPEDLPVEGQDGDDEGKKITRAATFPISMEMSEAELEWAKRVLQDSEALSRPNNWATSEDASRSQSRKHTRASRRPLSM